VLTEAAAHLLYIPHGGMNGRSLVLHVPVAVLMMVIDIGFDPLRSQCT